MNPNAPCPTCGKPLPPDAPMGICPDCLLSAGFGNITNDAQAEKLRAFQPPQPDELATHFPQLEVLELLGRGGMGAVYKARQKRLDRIVALKILPPGIGDGAAFAERFEREAKALAKLHHPQIVTLYEFGETDGLFYFLMEYVDGVTLRQLLGGRRIAPAEALAIVPQICDALQFAHDQGIVHRDIKPENILLNKEGQVKIADFGVAKIVARPGGEAEGGTPSTGTVTLETQADGVIGTPAYMAPEQIDHPSEVDHRADIYALGVVLYQMLTGELPARHVEAPSTKAQIDVRLDEVVLKALEKDPEQRYQQANELRTGVETLAGSAAFGSTVRPAARSGFARRSLRAPAFGLMLVAALNLIAALYLQVGALGRSEGLVIGLPFAIWAAGVFVILFGAFHMMRCQFYGWACAGALLAMLLPPGFLLGIPVGIWALVGLLRRGAPEAYSAVAKGANQSGKATGGDMHLGKRMIWVSSGVLLVLLAGGIFFSKAGSDEEKVGQTTVEPVGTTDTFNSDAAASDDFKVTFPNGASVEVMAVCRNPRATKLWWRPDGTPLPEGTVEIVGDLDEGEGRWGWRGVLAPWGISSRPSGHAAKEDASQNEVLIYVRRDYPLGWPDDLYGHRFDWTPSPSPTRIRQFPNVRWRGAESGSAPSELLSFGEMPDVLNLRVEIPMGPWEPVAIYDGTTTRELVGGVTAVFQPAPTPKEPGDVALEIFHNVDFRHHDLRLMARLKDGRIRQFFIHSTGEFSEGRFKTTVLVSGSNGFLLTDVKEYELARTKLTAAEIKGIRLAPQTIEKAEAEVGTGK